MRQFRLQPSLFMPEGMEGAGSGSGSTDLDPRLLAAMETQIQRSLATAFKKELPKLVLSQVQTAVDGMVDSLTDKFLDKLQEQLPTDEEIAAMEAEEAANGNGNGGAGDGADGQGRYAVSPELNARMLDYEKRIKQQDQQIQEILQARQDAEERAELADRVSQVQAALNSYPFVNDAAREVAFDFFINRVDRSDDGSLIADDLPLDKYVETNMANLGGLLSAKQVGGSGNSNHRAVRQEAPVFTMDQIKADMPKEQREALMAHAVTQLKGALANQGSAQAA